MSSLFYLNKYLAKYKWLLILGIICLLVSNIFGVEMPGVVKDAVNDIFSYGQTEENTIADKFSLALIAAGLYFLFSLLKGIFLFFTRQTIIMMSRKIEYDLKNEIYQQYQDLSFNFYKKNSTGDLMNRISEDVSKVRMYLGPGIMYTINLVFLFILVIYKMVKTNPELTLYVLLPLPLMSLLIYFVSSILNKRSEDVQRQQSFLSTIVQESFSGIRVIKSHVKEKEAEKRFNREAEQYKNFSMKLATTNAFFMPTIILLIGISTILTIYIGSLHAQSKLIEPGEIAEFVIYVNMLTWPFASVGWVTSIIQRAAASQKRINEFLSVETEIETDKGDELDFNEAIEFDNLGITYENSGVTALKNINLSVKKGTTLGIIGKTGSGKSSLAYLLMRLIDPTTGCIKIDGKDLKDINLTHWRKYIGYVPQEHFLFSDTIKNNILFGVDAEEISDEQLYQAAKDAGIHTTIEEFPEGYETMLGERGINLSGGQKQRISIARALIKNPDILVLDDCLSAVDNETEEHILEAISKDLKQKTSIIISHRISSIKYADNIIVLDDGKLIESGTHAELMKLNGAYREIYRKQELQSENKQNEA
ncbi:MAG: ABC transporter ATP-binding protein/permease [Flavobacteriales bacterium]|nr:ABC transporter ATP-binding protein/permease [Flavobacteriales bacterium]